VNYHIHLVMVVCTILGYGLAAVDLLDTVQPYGLGHLGFRFGGRAYKGELLLEIEGHGGPPWCSKGGGLLEEKGNWGRSGFNNLFKSADPAQSCAPAGPEPACAERVSSDVFGRGDKWPTLRVTKPATLLRDVTRCLTDLRQVGYSFRSIRWPDLATAGNAVGAQQKTCASDSGVPKLLPHGAVVLGYWIMTRISATSNVSEVIASVVCI